MTSTPRNEHPVHPACRRGVEVTAAALSELGCFVEEAHPSALDETQFPSEAVKIMPFAFAAFAIAWWQRRTGVSFAADDVEPWTWVCAERGRKLSAVDYLSAVEYVQAWTRRLSWWWHDGYDLLLTPTVAEPPPPLGSFAAPNTGLRSAQIVAVHIRVQPERSPCDLTALPSGRRATDRRPARRRPRPRRPLAAGQRGAGTGNDLDNPHAAQGPPPARVSRTSRESATERPITRRD